MDSESFSHIGEDFTLEPEDLDELHDDILNAIPYGKSGQHGQLEQDNDLGDFLNDLDDMNNLDDQGYLETLDSLDDLDTATIAKKAGLTFLKFNPGVERGTFTSAYQFCLRLKVQTQKYRPNLAK